MKACILYQEQPPDPRYYALAEAVHTMPWHVALRLDACGRAEFYTPTRAPRVPQVALPC